MKMNCLVSYFFVLILFSCHKKKEEPIPQVMQTENIIKGTTKGQVVLYNEYGDILYNVSNIKLTLETNPEASVLTDNIGYYEFSNHPIGRYTVRLEKDGFPIIRIPDFRIESTTTLYPRIFMVQKSTARINKITFKPDSSVISSTWDEIILSHGVQNKLRSVIRVCSLDSSITISTIDIEYRKIEPRLIINFFQTNNDTIKNYKAIEAYVLPVAWREKKVFYKLYTLSKYDYLSNSILSYPTVSDSSQVYSFVLKN